MNSSEKIELLKTKRRERQSKVRQALLINEYVYTKYFTIYQEAAQYYNELNSLHPMKCDLRKCEEFKAWKMATNGYPIRVTRRYHKTCHTNIPVEQQLEISVQPESPTRTEQHLEISVQPESPTRTEQHLEISVQPESPTRTEQHLEISVQPESPTRTEQHLGISVQSESPTRTEQHLEISVQSESPTRTEQAAIPGEKIMQLKIPLIKPSVVTETLQILTQETIQEKPLQVAAEGITQETTTIHPSLHEELPQDIVDRIINELREDPELLTIMTDIEQDLEFEQVGIDLEIPEDRLENELENMMIW